MLLIHFHARMCIPHNHQGLVLLMQKLISFLNCVTSVPMSSISPDNSTPSIGFLGFLKPNMIRIGIQNKRGLLKPRILQSPVDTLVA